MNTFVYDIKNYLPQENIDIANKVFDKFDKNKTGEVPIKDLGILLRLLGFAPTDSEIKEMADLLEDDPKNPREVFNKEGLLACMARLYRDSDTIDELIACFKMFDKENRGHLSEPVFRYILSNLGDKFEDAEMDQTMKDCAPFTEVIAEVKYIDYVEYSKYLKDLEAKPKIKPEDTKGKGKKK